MPNHAQSLLTNFYLRINRVAVYMTASRFRTNILVALVLFATLSAIFWPVLIGGKVFAGQQFFELDTTFVHYPFYKFFTEEFRATHTLPLWGSYLFSGFPVYVSQLAFFHPLYILFGLFGDYITTYHWLLFFGFFFGAVFAYLCARKLDLSTPAALIVALVYIASQKNITWADVSVFANTVFFLPLLFFSVIKIFRREYTLAFVIVGILNIALALLAAFIQAVFYAIVSAALFAFFLDLAHYRKGQGLRKNFHTTLFLIFAILVGALIASPWILTVMNHTRLTERALGLAVAQSQVNYLNFTDLVKVFFVNISFFERFNARVDASGSETFFIGILPLLFVIIAFRFWRRNKYLWFFSGFSAFIFLLAVQYSPIYALLQHLPGFSLFRGPAQWFFVSAFSLAVLAGFGFEYARALPSSVFVRRLLWAYKYSVAIMFAFAALLNVFTALFLKRLVVLAENYFFAHHYAKTAGFPPEYYTMRVEHAVRTVLGYFSFSNYYFVVTVLFFAAAFFLLRLHTNGKMHRRAFTALSVAVIALNFALVYQGYWQWLPSAIFRQPPPIAELLKAREGDEPFRIHRAVYFGFFEPYFATDKNKKERALFEAATMKPNYNAFYGVDYFDGYEHLAPRRTDNLFLWVGNTENETFDEAKDVLSETKTDFPFFTLSYIQKGVTHYAKPRARGVLGMANVKYVISPLEFPSPWKTVYQAKLTRHNIPVFVMENPDVMPRVYFASAVRIIPEGEVRAFEELKTMSDFKKETLIECDDVYCRNFNPPVKTENDRLVVELLRPGLLRARTNTDGGRWLVYSETNLPTWEARIDGNQVPIYIANYVFQAVYVPAGEHAVEFVYPGIFTQARYAIRNLLRKPSPEYLLIRDKIVIHGATEG